MNLSMRYEVVQSICDKLEKFQTNPDFFIDLLYIKTNDLERVEYLGHCIWDSEYYDSYYSKDKESFYSFLISRIKSLNKTISEIKL